MWDQRSGLSAANIRRALDDSLRRLGTDYVDLYFAHVDDPDSPRKESLGTFDRAVREGKVRHVGASNYSAERLSAALAVSDAEGFARFLVVQTPYNLMAREPYESDIAPCAVREGLAVLPYYGLAKGFLRASTAIATSNTRAHERQQR